MTSLRKEKTYQWGRKLTILTLVTCTTLKALLLEKNVK